MQPTFKGQRMRSHIFIQWLLTGSLALLPLAAHAQADYPAKPITLVVGYPPGGSTDLTARVVGAELAKKLGQPVVIENTSGAGGALGAQRVVTSAADGYTLLLGSNNETVINKFINPLIKYDGLKDFTPIGYVASQPLVLVAAPKTGVKTADEFLALVKKNPGKFSYGSSGVGTSLHLAAEMVKQQAGIFMTHIPYRGVAPLTSDLIGNNIEFGVFVLSSGLPHIKSGKVAAIGLTQTTRAQAAPDIAALGEHPALKGLEMQAWFGLFGPANLPAAVVARLQKALNESLQTPEVRQKLGESGASFASGSIDLGKFMQTESAKYKRVVDFAKIKE
jgi:tripartite-type tricarboxylate transporter receptor subunit TctC